MKRIYPLADYFHCSSHKLNLVASEAASLGVICNTLKRIQAVLVFFDGSPKRMEVLRKQINEIMPNCRKERVQQICPTRWVDRHRTLTSFMELYIPIINALQFLYEMENDVNAEDLLNGITTFEAIFALHLSTMVAAKLKHLAIILQAESNDFISAHNEISKTMQVLKTLMSNESEFCLYSSFKLTSFSFYF